jgi:hypothetical protein
MIRRVDPAWLARLACLVAATTSACSARDTIATVGGRPPDDVGRDEYCAGSGPPVLLGGSCTGEIAEEVFRHAVCGCASLAFNADLVTDGYDSRVAPYSPGGLGGDVASNVGLDGSRGMTIGGDVVVSGSEGVEAGDRLDIGGDLDCGGPLGRSSSPITVDGSARIAGALDVGSLDVAGSLTTPPEVTVPPEVTAQTRQTAAVSVPDPCACDDRVLDVAAVVAAHKDANHDDDIGITPASWAAISGDATFEVPCGRFYLDEIRGTGNGTVTLRAVGRTAIFVGGNVSLDQSLVIEVAADAELDLFIDGTIQVSGAIKLGDPAKPRALRVYVDAGGSLSLAGGSVIGGNLYAPRADLAVAGPLEVFGALTVNRINSAAQVVLHYDRAVAFASDGCVD